MDDLRWAVSSPINDGRSSIVRRPSSVVVARATRQPCSRRGSVKRASGCASAAASNSSRTRVDTGEAAGGTWGIIPPRNRRAAARLISWSKLFSLLTLHSPGGQTADQLLLQDEEDQHDWQSAHQRGGGEHAPLFGVLSLYEEGHAHRQSVVVRAFQN